MILKRLLKASWIISLIKLFVPSKQKEKQYFDMGMAPLANVGTEEDSFLEEKVANLVYVFAQRFTHPVGSNVIRKDSLQYS